MAVIPGISSSLGHSTIHLSLCYHTSAGFFFNFLLAQIEKCEFLILLVITHVNPSSSSLCTLKIDEVFHMDNVTQ